MTLYEIYNLKAIIAKSSLPAITREHFLAILDEFATQQPIKGPQPLALMAALVAEKTGNNPDSERRRIRRMAEGPLPKEKILDREVLMVPANIVKAIMLELEAKKLIGK